MKGEKADGVNKRRNVRLESADGCNGDAVDIRNNYSWQIEAAAGCGSKKTKQVESASLPVYQSTSLPIHSYTSIPPFSMSISTPNKRSTPPELQPLVSRTTSGTPTPTSSSFSSFRDKMVRALSPNRDSGGEIRGSRRPSWGGEWLCFLMMLVWTLWRSKRVLSALKVCGAGRGEGGGGVW